MMYNPQKLHPISYVTSVIEAIKNNFLFVIIFVFFQMNRFEWSNPWSYITPGIVATIFVISFIHNAMRVYKTRYWIENNYLILTSGVFNLERKELHIKRIQSMDTTQSVVNRIFGGVSLQIKTPSDGIELDTVTKQQSDWIRQEIEKVKAQIESTSSATHDETCDTPHSHKTQVFNEMLYKLSNKNLLLMAMTSGAILVTFFAVAPIISTLQDVIDWSWLFGSVNHILQNQIYSILLTISVIILISYFLGILITMVKYYGYTLHREGAYLHIRYGLFNIRRLTVPITRIQAAVEERSFVRSLFGYTAYAFIITSEQVAKEDDNADGKVMILPFIKQKEARNIISDIVPHLTFNAIPEGLPWQGFHRRFWIVSLILLIGAGIGHYYFSAWLWLPALVIVTYLIIHSYIAVKKSGTTMNGNQISVKQVTLFGFRVSHFKHEKVIGYHQAAHPLMARANLSHFEFLLAKGATHQSVGIRFEDAERVKAYRQWYLKGAVDNEKNA